MYEEGISTESATRQLIVRSQPGGICRQNRINGTRSGVGDGPRDAGSFPSLTKSPPHEPEQGRHYSSYGHRPNGIGLSSSVPESTASGSTGDAYATCNMTANNAADKHHYPHDFEYSLFGCFQNCGLSIMTMFCYCLPIGLAAKASDCGPRWMCTFASLVCPCWVLQGVREATRNKFYIPGTCAQDCAVSFCCCYCSACQLSRQTGVFD